MASANVLRAVSYSHSNESKDTNETSSVYYQTYGTLIESIKQTLVEKADASYNSETQQKQITARNLKRKQRYDDDTQNTQKSIATGVQALHSFHELSIINEIRKRTYSHWQLKSPSRSQMIESGFFNCNVNDRVICIYCNLICQQFIVHDDPSEIHRILSPNCCFVKTNLISTSTSTPVILNEIPNAQTDIEVVSARACNQQFVEISKRHATYASWAHDDPLPAVDKLVRAGFFYTGTKAIVTCFYCNGSLQNWSAKDDPMIEHSRWFPHCLYAKQLCGDELYQKIQLSKRITQQDSDVSDVVLPLQIPDEGTLSKFVAARLDLPISQRVLAKFRLSIVKRCYEDQLRLKLTDFPSDIDLFMACLILQKEIEIINGKKENIIIPSQKLQKISEKNKQEAMEAQLNAALKCDKEEDSSATVSSTSSVSNTVVKHIYKTEEKVKSNGTSACLLCLTDEKRLACIPCGHLSTCVPCGHSLRTCPICRREIHAFVRVYT
ncbi:unnamed protein product [Didymodactylos carnosus]|uniref:RING-type domain-containing protein n=1 Tax=Didymodactylos carnosus TaxID=1234261 RepID=A0A815BP89_9BILA|nr:unnamed protein product [Didymodactylos carnosus]CAF1270091.1 unnamed protein product [Didymodactylos carnosus]CAF3760769.1 unnamed protein product [Didymodactylos carnosus]CAF4057560.1 unnamed protein product [Didymodactylos carnosus]